MVSLLLASFLYFFGDMKKKKPFGAFILWTYAFLEVRIFLKNSCVSGYYSYKSK